MNINIFDIEKSEREKDFILKNGDKGIEVIADLIDACKNDIPIVGSFIKLGKIAINMKDWFFIEKLRTFLLGGVDVDKEKKERFFASLDDDSYKRISSYLLHLLYSAEEKDKAFIMGRIYRARMMEEIDNEDMLRLCSIIGRAFLPDLHHLGEYTNENDEETIASQSFINLGLIDNYSGGMWLNSPSLVLNDTGIKLYNILEEAKWV